MSEPLGTSIARIGITYDAGRVSGRLTCAETDLNSAIWPRLTSRAVTGNAAMAAGETSIDLPWPEILNILREFGSRQTQQALGFRFIPAGEAADKIKQFSEEVRATRSARDTLTARYTADEIKAELRARGFTRRELKDFQLRDMAHLAALAHGANFSVPGAGKTTVAFALHMLTKKPGYHLLIVGPKASFPAWREIVGDCMDTSAPDNGADPFRVLEGSSTDVERVLCGGGTRFVISYDLMVRQGAVFAAYLARNKVHVILDEAHRIKAGELSQRGALLLNLANLPVRRDILTGTPMPQGPEDIAAQLGFLWPGHEYRVQIQRGTPPREVLGQLYVRTTKRELGLIDPKRKFYQVSMAPGQLALYGVIRNESLRQIAQAVGSANAGIDFMGAKRSVMRLLQLSSNPVLALKAISGEVAGLKSGLVDQVLSEGPSTKMRAVADHARALARAGEKVVIWTIFTETISELERMLADLNPVTLYGAVPTGEADTLDTREGRIRRFHVDKACQVMIANPAAAGEGISLHTVCHNAIYLDRSYVSTHYLQSVDRIHRLGLPPGVETYIHIYQTKAPVGLGSVDMSVGRRLATKLRNLQQLLDDPDLHQIALDEENADDPIDYDVELQDLVDLVGELEGKKSEADEDTE